MIAGSWDRVRRLEQAEIGQDAEKSKVDKHAATDPTTSPSEAMHQPAGANSSIQDADVEQEICRVS